MGVEPGWPWGAPLGTSLKALTPRPLGKQYIVEGGRENPPCELHSTAGRGEGTRYRVPDVAVSLVKHTLMDSGEAHAAGGQGARGPGGQGAGIGVLWALRRRVGAELGRGAGRVVQG